MAGASALNVNVTADATQLRAQLALAQNDLRTYAAQVKAAAAEINGMGPPTANAAAALDKAAAGFNAAKAAVNNLKAGLGEVRPAIEAATTATKNHGAATEAMVIVHELMSGRFTKVAGSAMIMTSRIQGASLAMTGLVGAMGVGIMVAAHFVEAMNKVSAAKLMAAGGAVDSGIGEAVTNAQLAKMQKLGVDAAEAGKAIHTLDSLPGMSADTLNGITSDLHALSARLGDDIPQAAAKVAQAWNLSANDGQKLLQTIHASTEAVEAYTLAAQSKTPDDVIKARTILVNELFQSTKRTGDQTQINADILTRQQRAQIGMTASGAAARNPQTAKTIVDRAALADSAEGANRLLSAIKGIGAATEAPQIESWAQRTDAALQKAVFSTEQSSHAQGANWQKIHEDMADTTVKFWQDQVGQTAAGTKNREEAERHLMTALEAQDMAHVKADATGARQALHDQLTALTEQQAAHHDDFQVVMQIEDQKIALLRGAGKEYTAELNRELTARENLIREHANKVAGIDLETINKNIENDRTELETKRADLAAQVSDYQITKQTELRELMAASQAKFDQEQFDLQNFMAVHQQETDILRKALEDQAALQNQHERTMAALRAQVAAADRADQQRTLNGYQQMFQGVGNAGKSAIEGLITGSNTFQQAEANVARAVLAGMVNLGTEVVSKWAAAELAKSMITDKAVLQRVIAEQSAGQSGWGAILAKWLGLEVAKTGATDAGAAARATAEAAASTGAQAPAAMAAVAEVERQAAVAGAGAFAATAAIPIVGPELAPGAGAAALAAVQAMAPMASFAVGAWELPHDMIAQVHAGEMIIPAGPAAAIRAGGSGSAAAAAGGGDVHLHVHAVDAGSVTALFRSQGADLARIVSQQLANNPSLRPRY